MGGSLVTICGRVGRGVVVSDWVCVKVYQWLVCSWVAISDGCAVDYCKEVEV